MTEQRTLRLPQADANGLVDLDSWEDGVRTSDEIKIVDFEGLIKTIPASVPVLEGGRDITNKILTHAVGIKSDGTDFELRNGATQVGSTSSYTMVNANSGIRLRFLNELEPVTNQEMVISAMISSDTTQSLQFEAVNWGDGTESEVVTLEFSSTPKRVSMFYDKSITNGKTSPIWINRTASGAAIGSVITVEDLQVEFVTGQANQNPSEYVAVLGDSDPEDGFAYYLTENGNTVTSNVVTEAVGSAITGYYWAHYPATTNLVQYSHEFDNAWWSKSNLTVTADDTVAPDGTTGYSGGTADKLVEDSASTKKQIFATLPSYTDMTFTLFAKAAERSKFRLTKTSWGTTDFDLSAGTVTAGTGTITALANGWYKCTATYTAAPAQAAIYIILLSDAGSDDYLGNGSDGLHIWGAQSEAILFGTPIVGTSGSTVNRSTCLMRYPYSTDVFNQTEGTLIFRFVPLYNETDISTYNGLFSTETGYSSVAFLTSAGSGRSQDLTGNLATGNEAFVSGNDYTIAVRWSTTAGEIQLGWHDIDGDGLWAWTSISAAYAGSYDADSWINLFYQHTYNNQLSELSIFDTDQGTDWIEEYDPDTWVYTPPVTTGGGVGKRGKPKKKFAVIDGKMIQVASYQEAQELFKHLKKTKEVPKKRTIKLKASGTYVSVFDNPNTPMPLRTVREILNKKEEAEEEEMLLLFLM